MLSVVICVVIIASTWRLLKDSLRLSLDGVPENIDVREVKEAVIKTAGVKDFHHLHIWAISTTQNAMTGHLVVSNDFTATEVSQLKRTIKHKLEHLNIQHATLETETEICADKNC